jgi:peptide/nickel transport system permease protein
MQEQPTSVAVPASEVTSVTDGVDTSTGTEKTQSYWQLVKRQYKKKKPAMAALYFIYFMFAVAIFADFIASDKPIACSYKGEFFMPTIKDYLVGLGISRYPRELANVDWKSLNYDWKVNPPVHYTGSGLDLTASFVEPFTSGSDHYLGTDQVGHDLLAGLIHGSRIALSVGFVSMGIATFIGLLLGALAGYFGGWVDITISRLIELFLNFPVLFLILAIVAFLGGNIFYTMIIIGLTGWMGIARLVRGEVLRVRGMEYIAAAKSLGYGPVKIILRHVLPNSLAPVLVSVAFGIAGAILLESSLSFLGFGVPHEIVTWGSALNESRSAIFAWWQAVFPGMMIFLTVLSYNMIGDGLRDATDPRLKV